MIKSIEIKNFKSIKKKLFPLRNLNLLLGLNGMGKSSFIQSLLLLRQSDRLQSGELKLMGYEVNIGTTKDAYYQYSKKGEFLSFEIAFSDEQKYMFEYPYVPESNTFNNNRGVNTHHELHKQSLWGMGFQYLNAERVAPRSVYQKHSSNVNVYNSVGNYGEYTAHFIDVKGNDDIEFENLVHKDSSVKDSITGKEIVVKALINQINLWMGEISPGVNIRTTSISSDQILLEYVYKQRNLINTNRFKPENVGFGITYCLPIVTSLLAAKPGELIIIENPESHIHPRGQAELGKLIALTAMNDVQIIIETHSDHILNGIRVAVKEGDITKNKVIAFYFDKKVDSSEQYSKITNIEIDKNGELSEYPKNLIDEWSNQMFKLV